MHNDEICSVYVGLLYFVLHVRDNKQTHSSSSNWRECSWGAANWSRSNRGTAAEADAIRAQFSLTKEDNSVVSFIFTEAMGQKQHKFLQVSFLCWLNLARAPNGSGQTSHITESCHGTCIRPLSPANEREVAEASKGICKAEVYCIEYHQSLVFNKLVKVGSSCISPTLSANGAIKQEQWPWGDQIRFISLLALCKQLDHKCA